MISFSWSNEEMVEEFKDAMLREFEMTNLGLMKYFLGFEIKQGDFGIFVSQEAYKKGYFEEKQDERL